MCTFDNSNTSINIAKIHQDLLPMKKILKDKYPEEDIDRLFREEDYLKLANLLFTR